MNESMNAEIKENYEATYCPEDDKLRLYVGRVSHEEYLELRDGGWKATPKQECDFVTNWTVKRQMKALEYSDIVSDEDTSPQERAVARAERFAGYRTKRTGEALEHAENFESTPRFHGFQSEAKAERAARKHDRIADKAVDAWSKAEYWQHRTAGVISHALHICKPSVRQGRIKEIETRLRKVVNQYTICRKTEINLSTGKDGKIVPFVWVGKGMGAHWVEESRVEAIKKSYEPVVAHLEFRLAYENQMIEAQGGRAADVIMVVGGWLGNFQIRKINKSTATKKVVSVQVKAAGKNRWDNSGEGFHLENLNIERMGEAAYREPTEEEVETLKAELKAEKLASKKPVISLINPTLEEAKRLQEIINEDGKSRTTSMGGMPEVKEMTQEEFSSQKQGYFGRCETEFLAAGGLRPRTRYGDVLESSVCKMRFFSGSVVVLTDKKQKALPESVWNPIDYLGQAKEILPMLLRLSNRGSDVNKTDEETEGVRVGILGRVYFSSSYSQFGLTDLGFELVKEAGLVSTTQLVNA